MFNFVTSGPIEQQDRLASFARGSHFRDALSANINHLFMTPSQLQHGIFAHMPSWVNTLMSIRNRVVKWFGFNTSENTMVPESIELDVGDTAGFMHVIAKYPEEIISYAEDRHMAFYLSVSKRNNKVIVSTLVNQKTVIGRLYVTSILPFHYIIARAVIHSAVKAQRI
ncbi:DUF2867 domain-containing protein [Alteromonas oceanisediminis]|uniref:DUF2867 domain-containing protein n=1 Tax=Alteromonas oceanisediminis TaxID=2836180 RepID=UPI001BDB2E4D|nr:DUF2867 domain-containing protein [Alteromonas oceanisediminis]MBT0588044.1 DUF2867 domain-containing protein [Alteromonas oceanisediminis]